MGSRHPATGLASSRSPLVADARAEYFEPPSRIQLLDKLHHLIRFSDFLILLEGPSGSGKSTLLRQLRRQTEGGRSARLRLQEVTGSAALLRRVGEASDLEPPAVETEGAWLEQLYAQARLLEETGQQWLLLIDNAGLLDDEALQLLLNFQRAASRQLRLVLADQSVLARLQGLGLDELLEGRFHREELKPFDNDEAEDFIRLCYPALEVFDGRRLQKLVQHSDRLPGSLERLAGDALRLGRARAPVAARPRSGLPVAHLSAVGLVLVLLLGMAGWIWWQPSPETRISERVSVPLAVPVMSAVVEAPVVEVVVEPAPVQAPSSELPAPRPAGLDSTRLRPAKALPVPEQSDGPVETMPSPGENLPVAAPEPVTPPESPVATKPLAEPEAVQERPAQLTSDKTSGADVQESVGPEVATLQAMPAKGDSSGGEALLLSWPDQGYTLQMLGARQAETASDFIASQAAPGAFHYFSTLYKGKPWHVVVHGRYDSRKAAVEAVATLPAELRQLKPWARSIQSVKADIRKKSQ